MPASAPTAQQLETAKNKVIVALDVDSAAKADEMIAELAGVVGAFKIGLQLFTAAGPDYVRRVAEKGVDVFLDLKFHDIPNTVASAGVEAAKLGVWMFNVHAAGGSEMMRRTAAEVAEYCESHDLNVPKMIAVTVLTSSGQETLDETGVSSDPLSQVIRLAKLTAASGLDGVVASAREAAAIKAAVGNSGFLTVTPGVRPKTATIDDQKRVMTPGEAASNGSDYLVIGRPVTAAADPRAAAEAICREISTALAETGSE